MADIMKPADAVDLAKIYIPRWVANRDSVDRIDRWYRGKLDARDMPTMPPQATKEHKELRDRSLSRWLKLAVTVVAQSMYVEGYRRSNDPDNAAAWSVWQANGMDARQIGVHRGALAHGLSYLLVLPGTPFPVMRGRSARRMMAFYQDPAVDEWPMYAIEGEKIIGAGGQERWRFRLYDDVACHVIDGDENGGKLDYVTYEEHGAGVVPVARYANELDLDGRSDGEVEPNINLAARIDQDTFDRLVVQRFGAWLVRYVAGMEEPDTDSEKRATKLRLSIEDFLVASDPDTKFGAFPATPLDGYIAARNADIRDFAATTQTPPQDLLGEMINISAEALAAAEAGKTRKIEERKHSFGESHEQALRLVAHLMGDVAGAEDFEAQVVWRDMESRSLAQAADALGKLAQMLNVPVELLWEKIPGFTQQDVERAKTLVAAPGGMTDLLNQLAAGQTSGASIDVEDAKARADALGVLIRAGVDPDSAATIVGLPGAKFTGAVPSTLRLPVDEADKVESRGQAIQ